MFGFREKIQTEYKRDRSVFWFRITENQDGGYNFDINQDFVRCIDFRFPELEATSPTRWRKNDKFDYLSLWIPADRAHEIDLNAIKEWAEFAGNECIWIKPRRMIQYFPDGTLEFCIAGDLNVDIEHSRKTRLGEAEHQVKYGTLTDGERRFFFDILKTSIVKMENLLPIPQVPFERITPLIFSSIPAEPVKNNSFVQNLTSIASTNFYSSSAINPVLNIHKPQIKSIRVEDKINSWRTIYSNSRNINLNLSFIAGATVVIVDDLYQSGTTMLAYAEFLKRHGAGNIYGLCCVKAMRNSDNLA